MFRRIGGNLTRRWRRPDYGGLTAAELGGEYFHTSPEHIGPDRVRSYLPHLIRERPPSRGGIGDSLRPVSG